MIAGLNAARLAEDPPAVIFPATTALGALARYISSSEPANCQPANIALGLLPPLKKQALVARALEDLAAFATAQLDMPPRPAIPPAAAAIPPVAGGPTP